jgi:signal transduction histidine kinase
LSFFEPKILSKGFKVTKEFDDITIKTDKRLLKQILLNLLSNAVKFSHDSGALRLSLTKVASTNRMVFRVADTGIGMTAEEAQDVREPFVKIESAYSRSNERTGLGLPLVDRFADIIGAKMHIYSKNDEGTQIEIEVDCGIDPTP